MTGPLQNPTLDQCAAAGIRPELVEDLIEAFGDICVEADANANEIVSAVFTVMSRVVDLLAADPRLDLAPLRAGLQQMVDRTSGMPVMPAGSKVH